VRACSLRQSGEALERRKDCREGYELPIDQAA
jgi:hypothetical protein